MSGRLTAIEHRLRTGSGRLTRPSRCQCATCRTAHNTRSPDRALGRRVGVVDGFLCPKTRRSLDRCFPHNRATAGAPPPRTVEVSACAQRSLSVFFSHWPRRPPRKKSPSRWCRACPAARPMWRSTRAISATPASTSISSASICSARRWRFSPPTRCRWRKAASMPDSTIRWRRACRWRWRWKAARRRPITRSSSAPI